MSAALVAAEAAINDFTSTYELDEARRLLYRKRAQLQRLEDYRAIGEQEIEAGDEVVIGGGGKVYVVAAVRGRRAVLYRGDGGLNNKGKPATFSVAARMVSIPDRLYKEAKRAHRAVGGAP
jgi:hypothetical protein